METLVLWLEGELRKRDWRASDLAAAAGLTNATVSRIRNGTRGAGPDVCVAIARALHADPALVFRRAGILPPTPQETAQSDPVFREILLLYTSLPPGDQQTALRMLRGLASSAGNQAEVARAQSIEQMFSQGADQPLDGPTDQRRRVISTLFNTLANLSEPEDLEWAAQWITRAQEIQEQERGEEETD